MTDDRRFQYAKSTDPAVLDAIRRRVEARREWRERALAWGEKYGSDEVRMFDGWGSLSVTGLPTKHAPAGWTKPDRHGVSRPKKGTPEYAEMAALTHVETRVPGLDEMHTSADRARWGRGARFVVDGVAYFGLAWVPDKPLGPQWVEVLASEFRDAAARHDAAKERGTS